MPQALANRSHPVDSTRVDWLSVTLKAHTPEHLYDLQNYLLDLGQTVVPDAEWGPEGRGRFYATKVRHPSGLQLQHSVEVPGAGEFSEALNRDLISVEIPGSVWGFLSLENRQALIGDLRQWPGMMRVTRLDLETTRLEAEQDAEWIVREVAAGRLWPKGFGVGMAYANRNLHGDLHGACTQYFGGKESNVRSRHYDKAAEAGWDVPAVRHEVQMRNEPADQWFRRLADRCQTEEPAGPLLMAAEASTVKDALGSLVDFRDTSRWEGRRKPKKWAQSAPVPGWWREVIGPAPVPLKVEYRPPGDLEASRMACVEQYGRKNALWALLELLDGSREFADVAIQMLLQEMACLDEGDWKILDQLQPGCDPAILRGWVEQHRVCGQRQEAGDVPTDPTAPPC